MVISFVIIVIYEFLRKLLECKNAILAPLSCTMLYSYFVCRYRLILNVNIYLIPMSAYTHIFNSHVNINNNINLIWLILRGLIVFLLCV